MIHRHRRLRVRVERESRTGEERQKESREKRAEVYAAFLAAARDADAKSVVPPRDSQASASQAAVERITQKKLFSAALVVMRKQQDLIYIYGSDDGWSAADDLYTAISRRYAVAVVTGTSAPGPADNVDAGLLRFQNIFCREASATPRKGCG